MLSTKQRIILNAEKLFYDYGIANVRLQQIADETSISVGNLAYHYNNKESIVEAVYQSLIEELSDILIINKISPGLNSFDIKFSRLYKFMERNIFYYTNFWEIKRNYPEVNQEMLNINNKIFLKLKKRIDDNVKRGVMRKEEYKGGYTLLARALMLSINSWMPQQILNNRPAKEEDFKKFMWNLISPYLTEKGRKEFKALHS